MTEEDTKRRKKPEKTRQPASPQIALITQIPQSKIIAWTAHSRKRPKRGAVPAGRSKDIAIPLISRYRPVPMLDTNRLLPPRSFLPPPRRSPAAIGADARTVDRGGRFVSAEDFDTTGILTGVDLCASSYWWIPELHALADLSQSAPQPTVASVCQATARTSSRTSAAA